MFKKILAGLGINGAKVDFVIPQQQVELGGVIDGEVYVRGGAVDQEIEEIAISLVVTSRYKHGDEVRHFKQDIGSVTVANRMMVNAYSPEVTIPVHFKMPYNIPISTYSTKYHFETSLDIKNAIDATDIDEIIVRPHYPVQCILSALTGLGFRLNPHSGDYNGRLQQFEYTPTKFMRGKLDEIELYMEAHEDSINIMLQIDKKVKGLFANMADDLDLDERHVFFTTHYSQILNPEQIATTLRDIIEREYIKIAW